MLRSASFVLEGPPRRPIPLAESPLDILFKSYVEKDAFRFVARKSYGIFIHNDRILVGVRFKCLLHLHGIIVFFR